MPFPTQLPFPILSTFLPPPHTHPRNNSQTPRKSNHPNLVERPYFHILWLSHDLLYLFVPPFTHTTFLFSLPILIPNIKSFIILHLLQRVMFRNLPRMIEIIHRHQMLLPSIPNTKSADKESGFATREEFGGNWGGGGHEIGK